MAKKRTQPPATPEIPAHQGNNPPVGYCSPPTSTQFKPGESGNPKGRPSAGGAIKEWINQMAEWTRAEIQKVLEDDDAPASKQAAARTWVHATSRDFTNGGIPIAGPEFDRIVEHTDGKPRQQTDVNVTGKVTAGMSDEEILAASKELGVPIPPGLEGKA